MKKYWHYWNSYGFEFSSEERKKPLLSSILQLLGNALNFLKISVFANHYTGFKKRTEQTAMRRCTCGSQRRLELKLGLKFVKSRRRSNPDYSLNKTLLWIASSAARKDDLFRFDVNLLKSEELSLNKLAAFVISLFLSTITYATSSIVNVYVWGGEIPKEVQHDFEQKYGIKVNFSTYDNNETMYAKLKATRRGIYDVIMPSGYYVERMRNQGMLQPLNPKNLPNLRNLSKLFQQADFDPQNQFSAPIIWGITGIFYNQQWIKRPPEKWQDLWEARWREQLLLLDDAREVFAIALLSLGYNPNDTNQAHLTAAYQKLLQLVPNIKLFASESIQAIIIDEDARLGSSWNGDANKAHQENPAIAFIYPQDGFVIWSDCLAIPKNAPHPDTAHLFINYILSIQAGKKIAQKTGFAITNEQALNALPDKIRHNPLLYPSEQTLKHAFFQRDVGEEAIRVYNHYWEKLKLAL